MAEPEIQTQDTAHEPGSCQVCGREARGGRSFLFRPPGASPAATGTLKCTLCGLRHAPMLRRSAIVALVVGTVLTLLNQGDGLFSGEWNNALYWKIPLTYCVPFLVATYGSLAAARR